MISYFKRLMGIFNRFDYLILALSALLVVVSIYFKSDVFTIIVAVLGLIGSLMVAKGRISGNIICIIMSFFYGHVAYVSHLYGELLVYLFVMVPFYIANVISWKKNLGKDESVKVNSLGRKELIYILCVDILLFVGIYFFLRALNTDRLLVSTFSMLINITALYFLYRRSKYSFLLFLGCALIFLILWLIPLVGGELSAIALVFEAIIMLLIDVKGLFDWTKKE